MPADLAAKVHRKLDQFAKNGASAFGIALSGGGDSTALMHLAHEWAARTGTPEGLGTRRLMAATVDHGLRPEARAEALAAGRAAQALGIPHQVLEWRRVGVGGNLMAQARQARLQLLSDWARAQGLDGVLLGHNLDDQAETLLMRLGRGAGVDGLSGMAVRRRAMGVLWLRPMLEVGRDALRDWLGARGISWVDDPSNDNSDYDRVRLRKAFAGLGLPAEGFASAAANLAQAQEALQIFADHACQGALTRAGSLQLPLPAFAAAPFEIRRRILVAGLRWISGAPYAPRRENLQNALAAIEAERRTTLDGVILTPAKGWLHFWREPAMAQRCSLEVLAGSDHLIWDDRWRLTGLRAGQTVSALGYPALSGVDWRQAGLSFDEAAASPAVRVQGEIIAAPAIFPALGLRACPIRDHAQFRALLYSH